MDFLSGAKTGRSQDVRTRRNRATRRDNAPLVARSGDDRSRFGVRDSSDRTRPTSIGLSYAFEEGNADLAEAAPQDDLGPHRAAGLAGGAPAGAVDPLRHVQRRPDPRPQAARARSGGDVAAACARAAASARSDASRAGRAGGAAATSVAEPAEPASSPAGAGADRAIARHRSARQACARRGQGAGSTPAGRARAEQGDEPNVRLCAEALAT